MNRMSPIARMIISLILLMVFQYVLSLLLNLIGLNGLAYYIVFELVLAFVFAWFYYPYPTYRGRLKVAIRDSRFHKTFAIFFVVLIVLGLIF